jgi:hypothetical protein
VRVSTHDFQCFRQTAYYIYIFLKFIYYALLCHLKPSLQYIENIIYSTFNSVAWIAICKANSDSDVNVSRQLASLQLYDKIPADSVWIVKNAFEMTDSLDSDEDVDDERRLRLKTLSSSLLGLLRRVWVADLLQPAASWAFRWLGRSMYLLHFMQEYGEPARKK